MTEAAKELPVPGQVFEVEGHTAFVVPAAGGAGGGPVPWVWYAPTLEGLPGREETWMFEQFSRAGVAIAGIDVGESCGSPEGRRLFDALHAALVAGRGFAPRACLLARSRGGLMLYNWAAERPTQVACIAGIYPVCDLRSYPGLAAASSAYGMTESQLAASLAENNPVDRVDSLARDGVPIFHLHGDSDTAVPLEHNSAALVQRYRQAGGTATLRVVAGEGHTMWSGWFECQELVDFVVAHAGRPRP